MKNKSEVLMEYRKSMNKPGKYQALRLEIEVDKRDVLMEIEVMLTSIAEVLNSLKEESATPKQTLHNYYEHPLTEKEIKKCVKETK